MLHAALAEVPPRPRARGVQKWGDSISSFPFCWRNGCGLSVRTCPWQCPPSGLMASRFHVVRGRLPRGGRQALEDLPEAPAEAEEAPAVTAAPPSLVLGEAGSGRGSERREETIEAIWT